MLSLLVGTAWIVFRRDLLLQYFYFSELLALTHVFTLGFATSLMMGVLIRLAPVSLKVGPRSGRLSLVQYGLFLVGTSGMVFHFSWSGWLGMAWATVLVFVAAVLQAYNFSAIFELAREGDWAARYVSAALIHLVLAAALGMTVAFNKALDLGVSLLPGAPLQSVFAHAHLAALGWVTTMIFGFELKLVPTTRGSEKSLPWRFGLLQGGTLGLAVTLLTPAPHPAPFALMIAIAIAWHAKGTIHAFVTGRAMEWETAPLVILVVLAATGLLLALDVPHPESPLRARVQLAYGFTAVYGWIVLTVTTVAFKLFPMWVWQERFQADFGKKPVPGMKDLASPLLRAVSLVALTAGVLVTAAAILSAPAGLLVLGTPLLGLGVLTFVVNFVRVARWALLPLTYRPRPEDWAKFREMFPER